MWLVLNQQLFPKKGKKTIMQGMVSKEADIMCIKDSQNNYEILRMKQLCMK